MGDVELPADNSLVPGTETIAAGESITRGGVVFTCAADAGDAGCTLTVSERALDNVVVAMWSGAAVTAAAVPSPPPPPAPMEVSLPTGYARHATELGVTALQAGGDPVMIPAGGYVMRGGVVIRNNHGSEAASVLVKGKALDGRLVLEYTGGDVSVEMQRVDGYKALAGGSSLSIRNLLFDREGYGDTPATGGLAELEGVTYGDNGITLSQTTHDEGGEIFGDGINDLNVTVAINDTTPKDTSPFAGCDGNTDTCMGTPVPRSAAVDVASAWNNPENAAETWGEEKQALGTESDASTIWTTHASVMDTDTTGRTVHVDVYSDFELDKKILAVTAFVEDNADTADVDESLNTTISPAAATILGLSVSDDTRTADGELNTTDPDDATNADWAHVMFGNSEHVPSTMGGNLLPGETQEFDENDAPRGTFKGVPGTFQCATGGGCMIDYSGTDTEGNNIVEYVGDFVFRPDGASWVFTADTDWLAAGVWVTVPADPLGDHEFGAYVYGSDPFTPGDLGGLTVGSATYNGTAAGRYAEREGDDLRSGQFSASVSLMADFDADTISGSVSEFMAGGHAKDDWLVNLEEGAINNTENSFGGQTSGLVSGGRGLHGIWNGQFYGNGGNPAIAAALDEARMVAAGDDEEEVEVRTANDDYVTALEADLNEPGSAAGTFAATDRDRTDGYSVTLGGAYGAHNTGSSR
jgi:hypothetical protein